MSHRMHDPPPMVAAASPVVDTRALPVCSVPGCRQWACSGYAPPFPYRLLRVIAAWGPTGLETVGPGGQVLRIEQPEPGWIRDPAGWFFWLFDSAPLPPNAPLCAMHRAVWNMVTGEVAHLGPRRLSEWEARHSAVASR